MKNLFLSAALLISVISTIQAQIKIGNNPQNIDASSILELESNNGVLVITRVSDSEMNTIAPLQGALVYNTDIECVFYYNGTTWVNLCIENIFNTSFEVIGEELVLTDNNGDSVAVTLTDLGIATFTHDPVFNPIENDNTIEITETGNNVNIEVGEITGFNIVDSSINGFLDIQDRSTPGSKLQEDAIDAFLINPNVAGDGLIQDPTGALEVDITQISGNGELSSGGTIDITGNATTALLENLIIDVADNAITKAKVADDAIGTDEIINDAITEDKILDASITNGKLDKNTIPISGFAPATLDVDFGNRRLINVDDPVAITDAANRNYVDNAVGNVISLTDGTIYIGDDTNNAQEVAISGDATMDNAGVLTIADDAITNVKVADNAITTNKIADGAVTATDIAADAVNAITINPDVAGTGLIQNAGTGALEIDPTTITADGDITSTDLTVTGGTGAAINDVTLEINAGAVGNTEIAADAITTDKIAAGAVTATDIAADAVNAITVNPDVAGTGLTQNAGTGALEIDPTTITADGDITSTDLTVTGGTGAAINDVTLEINAGAVGNTEIAADAITTDKIAIGAVTATDIAADAVNAITINPDVAGTGLTQNAGTGALEIDPTTITADGDITSTDLAVTGGTGAAINDVTLEINAGAVGNTEIATDAITTDKIAIGAITATDIAADAVNAITINPDVAGTGLTQNAGTGALEIDPTTITADGSISSTHLSVLGGNGAVINDVNLEINPSAVGNTEIANDAITTNKIADGAIIGGAGGKILDNSITASDLAPDSVDASEIRINAVGQSEIRDDAVATGEILNLTILNEDISATAGIEGSKIFPNFNSDITTPGNVTANSFISATMTYPDYVFQKYFSGSSLLKSDYVFNDLKIIESFLKKNHHLPGIKSALEIEANGGKWNLTEGALKNLEKIEELFLHTIEQEKKIDQLKSENEVLAEELDTLKKDLAEIKELLKKQ